ncbi:hypothetical protein HMJ29_02610 [Hymenobacter taeanensis]|uniref:Transmembrane protein n=1 Tax=Hymenobacter taeanensis TaxID=2735321 RepID=A0A6M6BCE7_9BACT|nr:MULTISPECIES: hypothetical protein [Hymenobacter]QJX45886.1 hypothetical protein HMJ29_02610 [Hymenobacter taeanensis]UOQ79732.1 hypothetical protein MUN83_12825 [Hymenobacter sp. 5414T-23]
MSRVAPSPPVPRVSAGRSLSVLILALAVLWLWSQFPAWYASGYNNALAAQQLQLLWFQPWLVGLLVVITNVGTLHWATLPLALPSSPGSLLDAPQWQHDVVFWSCVCFHIGSTAALIRLAAMWLHS